VYAGKVFGRYWAKKQVNHNLSQEEANQLFEEPGADVSRQYATIIKTVLFTMLYAPAMPIIIPISILGLVVEYRVDKYLLLRRQSTPVQLGKDIAVKAIAKIKIAILWFSCTTCLLWVYAILNSHFALTDINTGIGPVLALLISLVINLLPSSVVAKCYERDEFTKSIDYESQFFRFETDYDFSNPACKKHAVQEYLTRLERSETDLEGKKEIRTKIEELNQGDPYLENFVGTRNETSVNGPSDLVNLYVSARQRLHSNFNRNTKESAIL